MKTILVVDDELGSAEALSLILEDEGYRVFCAVNGTEGLEKAADVRPDLIILDFIMPVMDGARMGEHIRADPRFNKVKLLLNSGLPEELVRQRFAAFDAFMRKPYDIDQALACIRSLIGT